MRYEIITERPNLMEPYPYVSLVIKLSGYLSSEQIIHAVENVYQNNETTRSRIVLSKDGTAYYESGNTTGCRVFVEQEDYKRLLKRTVTEPFDLKNGELIRTFVIPKKNDYTILIVAHHLAGDGMAISGFAKEVLDVLDGKQCVFQQTHILTKQEVNRMGRLPKLMAWYISRTNRKWAKCGKAFTWKDYEQIHKNYWQTHNFDIKTECYESQKLEYIKAKAKQCQVTVNSYLVAVMQSKYSNCKIVGIPVSVRNTSVSMSNEEMQEKQLHRAQMNNMTTGLRIKNTYNPKKTIDSNAREIHSKIRKLRNNPSMQMLALTFVSELRGSLMDAVLMQTHGLYQKNLVQKMAKAMGYIGKNKTQIGITNLGIVDMKAEHSDYIVKDFLFIPPKVSYSNLVIGVAAFDNKLSIVTVN